MRQNKVYICVHTLFVFLFCDLFTTNALLESSPVIGEDDLAL